MKLSELLEDSDFRKYDPFRTKNTGTPMSDDELIKFHERKLAELGPDAPKSHRTYHEKYIRLLKKRSRT